MKLNVFVGALLIVSVVSCNSKYEKSYYSDNSLRYKVPIKNGQRHGTLKQYYRNGQIELISNWQNGKKYGLLQSYYPSGQPKSIEYYRGGMIVDSLVSFYESGAIKSIVHFKENKKKGLLQEFYSNGNIRSEANYADDKLDGKLITFYEDQQVHRREIYSKDSLIYSLEYGSKGQLQRSKLPITVKKIEHEYSIGLSISFFDSSYVAVYLGILNNQFQLTDTTQIVDDPCNLNAAVDLKSQGIKGLAEGFVVEVLCSNDDIIAAYPFRYDLESENLVDLILP